MKRFLMLMTMTAAFACAMTLLPQVAWSAQEEQEEKKSGESTAEKVEERSESIAERAARAAKRGVKKGAEATKKGAEVVAGAAVGAARGTKAGIVGSPNVLTPDEQAAGWELLFNGQDLTGFRGFKSQAASESWTVADGAIAYVGEGTDLVTEREFGSFELTFDWKLSPGGNSGVMYLVTEEGDETYWSGPEYQILDNGTHPDAKQGSNGNRTSAACYDLYPPSTDVTKPVGEWNTSKIVVRGNHVEHWLNGEKVVEYERGSDDWNQRVEASKFKEWPMFAQADTGHVVFQDHGDDVWYRNIKIKELN